MLRRVCRFLLCWGLVSMLGLWGHEAIAHPLGNFTLNHFVQIGIQSDGIALDYVLDEAEIPAFQEIVQLDTNHNQQPDPEELGGYAEERCAGLRPGLDLRLADRPQSLTLMGSRVEFPPGVGGLLTLRLECRFQASQEWQVDQPTPITLTNRIYEDRLGWREMVVTSEGFAPAATGRIPVQSGLPGSSISQQLREYPTELLQSPPDQRQGTVLLYPSLAAESGIPMSAPEQSPRTSLWGRAEDAFTGLIKLDYHQPLTAALALVIAFLWGGFHALTPGHGKTMVGAYLIGSRGTAGHALLLGIATTLTHTAGVFVLGLAALGLSQVWVTEQIYDWLGILSGILVMGVGGSLLWRRVRGLDRVHNDDHHGHHHHHEHSHDHEHHSHDHHDHSHGHHHHEPTTDPSWGSLIALGISGGLLPCPSALVAMLGSVALGKIGFGLVLVTSFSLGLAAVLTGLGLLVIYARRWVEGARWQMPQLRLVPVLSALLILLVGVGMTAQAWGKMV
ncbi:MAG: nickel/cobalt transporter [Cyanophyceae cyanobacterium]